MDVDLIKKALCFHGKPMQKIWDDERGAGDLQKLGVPEDGNYSMYMERQKYFTFQDRAKRLKLHQFLARKAPDLYDTDLLKMYLLKGSVLTTEEREKAKYFVARVPSYEIVMSHKQDKTKILRRVLESLQPGDIIYAIVIRSKSSISSAPIVVKPLCTGEPCVHILKDSNIKALIPNQLVGTLPLDKLGKPRSISTNDYLCCEMVEFSIDADRMTLCLDHTINKHKNAKLGIINQDELPLIYRKTVDNTLEKYEECIRKAKEFENPNCKILYIMNGLVINDTFSVMRSLKCEFPRPEYAKELRQIQASKWAFRSVAEGIEYFKIGQHVEAFQCLNRALNIDPRNVEGLVARGALYANKGSFLKAVEDFEKALKLNAYHVNARKYMGETLVALARSYEEDNRIQDAAKAYRDCLNIIPNHEQARLSLEAIQQRTGASVEPLSVPVYESSHITETEKPLQKQKPSPPSISSNESNATESSSDSGSNSPDIPHTSTSKKDRSLSPLSKKMALHSASLENSNKQPKFNQPFYMTQTVNSTVIPNEFKLDEDDTETRVRKLLHEASKHKKEKKKSKKKKSKKSKKSSSKNKESTNILDKINLEEAYKFLGSGLHFESKLNENLKLYEQTIAEIKKRQEILEQAQQTVHNAPPVPVDIVVKKREKSETPPPKAPSMRISSNDVTSSSAKSTNALSSFKIMGFGKTQVPPPPPSIKPEPPKFSFQIKKPVKVDKFGLVRLATPALPKSPTLSPERSSRSRHRSRSPGRRRSRSRSRSSRERRNSRYRRQRSTTRSRSLSPYNKRRYRSNRRRISRSFSRSRSHSRPQTKSVRRRGVDYRRSPSPFVARGTPSPRSRHRRSPSTRRSHRHRRHISRSPSHNRLLPAARHTNRTWQRPGYNPLKSSSSFTSNSSSNKNSSNKSSGELWPHDKFDDKNDGPSIEEIDEIINRAQKERKEEIIKRDKNILKKSSAASGKSTIAKCIIDEFDLTHISPGDLLRANIQKKTELGEKAESYVNQGKLVPDDIIIKFITDHIRELKDKPFLLDGFPRNVTQAKCLSKVQQLNAVINLDIPHEELIRRIEGRFVHLKSGRVYNTNFNKPKVPGKDDVTGEDLVKRDDDKPEVFAERLKTYDNMVKPVLEYYEKGFPGVLKSFNDKTNEEIVSKVQKFLRDVQNA
uniref:Adenylate kinase active site lid domain-containing protein n=1 Tax=Glossina brevipalpis TaxID=37001 RepID=A0A1A9WSF1_9MUSC